MPRAKEKEKDLYDPMDQSRDAEQEHQSRTDEVF